MENLKIIAIIHARMSSSRLPGKVLKKLCGKSVLDHHVERLRHCPKVEKIVLGTSKSSKNAPLIEEAQRIGIDYYGGSEEDVVERYLTIADREKADAIVRTGCDKPLFSYEIVNELLDQYSGEDFLYVVTPLGKGVGSEIVSSSALEKIHKYYRGPAITKHVYEYPHLFNIRGVEVDDEFSRPEFRLTLDTEEDLSLIRGLYETFYSKGIPVDIREVFKHLDDKPSLANMNRFVEDKEINQYVRDLEEKPVISIHRRHDGHYVLKNRMGQIIPRRELENIMTRIISVV